MTKTVRSPLAQAQQGGAEPPEIIKVKGHKLACDGGGGALGHPKVWYEFGDEPHVDCLYCDRRFVRKG